MDNELLTAPSLKPPYTNTSAPRHNEPVELDKLLKWQEARMARKLKGEYESAVLDLAHIVNSNLKTPLRLASIRVEGASNTRKSFLSSLLTPYLPRPTVTNLTDDTTTLESVLHTARRVGGVLSATDMFKHVDARIERSRDPLARPTDIDLVFHTREKGRYYLSTSTQVGNNEGGANATARVRNAFGGAETLEANVSFGTKTRVSLNASLAAPLAALTHDLRVRGELSVFALERDHTAYASCMEGVRGARAAVKTGAHELAYEAVLRHVGGLAPSASISMREAAGSTVKSAVTHTWTRDTRDNALLGGRGAYVRVAQELAGLGGDARFYKGEVAAQAGRRLLDGLTVSFAGRTGLLWALGQDGTAGRTLWPDRFQLGGPVSVRMFRANSMGPRDGADSLGGEMFWSAGVSLIGNVPRRPTWPVKLHAFVNAGRLDGIERSRSLIENIRDSISRPSISAGLGLVYRLEPVRVEVNVGVPLVASRSDGARRGLQVGVGLEFL